jgi:phthiocerol/phenolphthiocerol synthesis type-I polyketide synthase E
MQSTVQDLTGLEVAIIGMSGRFPGANTINEFWANLSQGIESVKHFSDAELIKDGIDTSLLKANNFIKASATIEGIDQFDASFFGYAPREAALLDPQHRIFLECAWEALEDAGYDAVRFHGAIGVFAGCGRNAYFHPNMASTHSAEEYQAMLNNLNDFLATRISYKMNLTGPSITVQCACSTSSVAIHLACQSLLSGDSDMALAGGVTLRMPHQNGYLYQPGGILSPDGHCRAFDEQAQGTVPGSGAGIIVLKRLTDAIDDGDAIYAVIKGSAINNDGSMKVGYTAPSVDGQCKVIRAAQTIAEVTADSISYIEAHGTGTALGDPIEITALTQAFQSDTDLTQFCAIGSVKTNIGHLDTAAGVTGVIKTALALRAKQIPPTVNFQQPSAKLQLEHSPFYINDQLRNWESNDMPRRAGVSSFGVGGTNAHIILEEAPGPERVPSLQPHQLLVISAKTETALDTASDRLAAHLQQNPNANLADVAYTLQVGRHMFKHRRCVVASSVKEAANALASADPSRVLSGVTSTEDARAVFMFPGQGSQYLNMAVDLYKYEPLFRDIIDECAEILSPHLQLDIRDVIYPDLRPQYQRDKLLNKAHKSIMDMSSEQIDIFKTWLAQPILFTIEYALAKLWMSWGVKPWAMIGHSLGEYVAACLAGVFSLNDGLAIVAQRGRLMQKVGRGSMLAVPLSAEEVLPYLRPGIELALCNTPNRSVIAGPTDLIANVQAELLAQDIKAQLLKTQQAYHTAAMDSVMAPLTAYLRNMNLQAPQLPFISNVTGTWITAEQATNPAYWADHMRNTVRFSQGIDTLIAANNHIFIEVGPGHSLSSFVRAQLHRINGIAVLTMRQPDDAQTDMQIVMRSLGQLWLSGVAIDWVRLNQHHSHKRVHLPTYPFERESYWIEFNQNSSQAAMTVRISQNHKAQAQSNQQVVFSPLEQQLRVIWQDVLGVERLTPQDNFFDIGGDSLMALNLIAKINRALNITLGPRSIFQNPSIAELARVCAEQSETLAQETEASAAPSQLQHLVLLKQGTQEPALFMVHPIGGDLYLYGELVEALKSDHTIYGIQAGDIDEADDTIEQKAQRYLADVLAVQASGPYLLSGFSFGGIIAYEMAQILGQQGQDVALLTLIDTPFPEDFATVDFDQSCEALAMLLNAPTHQNMFDEIWRLPEAERLYASYQYAIQQKLYPQESSFSEFEQLYDRLDGHLSALQQYRPKPYSGSMLYIAADTRPADVPQHPEFGWWQMAKGSIALQRVAGDHYSMIRNPSVHVVTQYIQQAIEQVVQETISPSIHLPSKALQTSLTIR